MDKVLPNRQYLFLALRYISQTFVSFFNGFYFSHFQVHYTSDYTSEPVVKNKHNLYIFLPLLYSLDNITNNAPPLLPQSKIRCYSTVKYLRLCFVQYLLWTCFWHCIVSAIFTHFFKIVC